MINIAEMSIEEIRAGIAAGIFVLHKKRLYTKEDYEELLEAKRQQDHYDLLQLTKKIQL